MLDIFTNDPEAGVTVKLPEAVIIDGVERLVVPTNVVPLIAP